MTKIIKKLSHILDLIRLSFTDSKTSIFNLVDKYKIFCGYLDLDKYVESFCEHLCPKGQCIYCSDEYKDKDLVVVYCEKCEANTWHCETKCCRCKTIKIVKSEKDLNIHKQ